MELYASVSVTQGDNAYANGLVAGDTIKTGVSFGRITAYTPGVYLSMDEEAAQFLIDGLSKSLLQMKVDALIAERDAAACTGHVDPDDGLLKHDGDTCPTHEA